MNEQASKMMNLQPQLQQQQQIMGMNQNQMMGMSQMNTQPQQQMGMNRSYGMWAPPVPQPQYQNAKPNMNVKPPTAGAFNKPAKQLGLGPRSNWKGKKVGKPNDKRRKDQQLQQKPLMPGSSTGAPGSGVNVIGIGGNMNFNYNPPTLNELQHQNRLKARKYFPKKNFNKNMNVTMGGNNKRFAPFAPRNTTSFLIRAKKSGGIAPLVSPYPVTPAVLPTPIFSPSREVLVDMAKEEWGLDGYGSMKGLIRLRSPGHEIEAHEYEEDEEGGGSSESDVEEHVEMERRLDHDVSRFEMIYDPNSVGGLESHNVLENRVDDQDMHIAQLEEENLILKDRLFLMERELGDLRRRLQSLERQGDKVEGENNDEVESENDSHGVEAHHSMEDNSEDLGDDVTGDGDSKGSGELNNNEYVEAEEKPVQDTLVDVEVKMETDKSKENIIDLEVKEDKNNYELVETNKNFENIADVEVKKDKNNCKLVETNKNIENTATAGVKQETNNNENEQDHVGMETDGNCNVIVEASNPDAVADVCMEGLSHVEDKKIAEN